MMTRFHPKRGFKIILSTCGLVSILLIPTFIILISIHASINIWLGLLTSAYGFIILMAYLSQHTTSYWIEKDKFYYKSLFLKGQIAIQEIRKIEVNASSWNSNKPATSNKNGMLIYYQKFEEVFISPADNEIVCQALLAINSDIEIIYLK